MEPRPTAAPGFFGGGLTITDRLWRIHVRNVARLVQKTMIVAGCNADVVLTDDRTVQRLNFLARGKNKPTNVLTYERPPEIFLGFGTVFREAREAGRSVAAHLTHLLVHGALHLAGHDHHHAGQARRMENAEARMLARLGVKNPWKNR
jgi:probable rRNA maturation factor